MPVSPYRGNIYEIPFGAAGMVAHENRWVAKRGEFLTAGNVTLENDLLQKDAAFDVYDPVGIDAIFYRMRATASVGGNWEGGVTLNTAPANASSVTPTPIANQVVTGQASPWVFTVSGTATVGSLLVISLYAPATAGPAFTDSRGNFYTESVAFDLTGAPSDPTGISYYQFQAVITQQLTNAIDAITMTFTGGGTRNFWLIASAYPASATILDRATGTPTGVSLTIPSNSIPFVARRDLQYPLVGIGGAFLDKDSGASTVTSPAPWSVAGIADRAGVGQLVQLYSTIFQAPTITAQIDWNSQFNGGPITGTVSVTRNGSIITGAGTLFLTELRVNDEILINNESRSVASIQNNTQLTTYTAWTQASAAGQTAIRRAGPTIVTSALQSFPLTANVLVVYKESSPFSTFTPPVPGLSAINLGGDHPVFARTSRFVVAGKESAAQSRKLFFFSGVATVSYLADDGTSLTALTATPADWDTVVNPNKQPVNGILHQGALFGWGNLNEPHRIYRSQTADHTSFTGGDSGQYPIASSIGERLWCGAEYQGVLFLWKYPRGIFYFDDTDPNFLNWSYHIRSEALGCAPSPHAVLPIDDDVLFCAPDGHFHLLSAVADLGGARTSDLTRTLGLHRWTREHLDITSLGQLCSVYNPYTKTAYFGVRSRTASTLDNDLLLKFDFGLVSRGGPVRFSYSTMFLPNALCIRRSASAGNPKDGTPLLMIGEKSTSFLQILEDGSRNLFETHGFRNDPIRENRKISTSYPVTAATPRLDFSDQDPTNRQRKKNYDAIEFVFGESDIHNLSNQTLFADIIVDGFLRQTITIANTTTTRVERQLKCGSGYDFQVQFRTDSTTSAESIEPTVVPDIVTLGIQIFWRSGSQDHSEDLG